MGHVYTCTLLGNINKKVRFCLFAEIYSLHQCGWFNDGLSLARFTIKFEFIWMYFKLGFQMLSRHVKISNENAFNKEKQIHIKNYPWVTNDNSSLQIYVKGQNS